MMLTWQCSPTRTPGRARSLWSVLVLDVFHQPLGADFGPENVAHHIRRDAFGGAGAGGLFHRVGNERRHRAVAHASDPDAALPAVMVPGNGFGLGIRDIDHVVLVDEDPARPAELVPLVEEVALLVENLDAIVVAVADEQPSARIHRQGMGSVD